MPPLPFMWTLSLFILRPQTSSCTPVITSMATRGQRWAIIVYGSGYVFFWVRTVCKINYTGHVHHNVQWLHNKAQVKTSKTCLTIRSTGYQQTYSASMCVCMCVCVHTHSWTPPRPNWRTRTWPDTAPCCRNRSHIWEEQLWSPSRHSQKELRRLLHTQTHDSPHFIWTAETGLSVKKKPHGISSSLELSYLAYK